MNEAAKKWVEALRSGKFEQYTCGLRNTKGTAFCCLGVACEISGLGEWYSDFAYRDSTHKAQDAANHPDPDSWDDNVSYEEEFTSPDVQKWLGLRTKDGKLTIDGREFSLAELNDDGVRFHEIADIIEKATDLFVEEPNK